MTKIKLALTTSLIFMLLSSLALSLCSFHGQKTPSTPLESAEEPGTDVFPQTIFPPSSQNLTIVLTRNVSTNDFLYTTILDTIKLTNNDPLPFNGLRLFFPLHTWKEMEGYRFVGVKDDETHPLQWSPYLTKGSYLGVRVNFPWYVEEDEEVTLRFTAHLPKLGEFRIKPSGMGELHYAFSTGPRFLHAVNGASARFLVPSGGDINKEKTDPRPATSDKYKVKYLKPYDYPLQFNSTIPSRKIATELKLYWTIGNLPLQITYFSRDIRYKLSDKLLVEEKFVLSPSPVTEAHETTLDANDVTIGVLKGARNITAQDDAGELSVKNRREKKQHTEATVKFRVPLTRGSRYRFTVSYLHNGSEGYIEKRYPEKRFRFQRNLTVPFIPLVNASVETVIFRLSLPTSLSLTFEEMPKRIELTETSEKTVFAVVEITGRSWIAKETLPYQQKTLQVTLDGYIVTYLAIYGRFSLMVFFIFTVFLSLTIVLPLTKEKEVTPSDLSRKKKRERLRQYIEDWERFTALEDMVDDEIADVILERGKRTFREIHTAQERLEDRRETLYEASDELKQYPTLRDFIRKLERTGSDLAIVRSMLLQRWRRYIERGKIEPSFKPYMQDLLRSLNTLRVKRDRFLNSLKDQLLSRRT